MPTLRRGRLQAIRASPLDGWRRRFALDRCSVALRFACRPPRTRRQGKFASKPAMAKVERTATEIRCQCGGTAKIITVAPIPNDPDHMLHTFHCSKCRKDTGVKVRKTRASSRPRKWLASRPNLVLESFEPGEASGQRWLFFGRPHVG